MGRREQKMPILLILIPVTIVSAKRYRGAGGERGKNLKSQCCILAHPPCSTYPLLPSPLSCSVSYGVPTLA